MAKHKHPTTQAVRVLRQAKIEFEGYPYSYEDGGGTALFAQLFDVDEHQVIKTLVMEDENRQPMIVLMHGDREVSTKNLARQIGVKSVRALCRQGCRQALGLPGGWDLAFRHTKKNAGLLRGRHS